VRLKEHFEGIANDPDTIRSYFEEHIQSRRQMAAVERFTAKARTQWREAWYIACFMLRHIRKYGAEAIDYSLLGSGTKSWYTSFHCPCWVCGKEFSFWLDHIRTQVCQTELQSNCCQVKRWYFSSGFFEATLEFDLDGLKSADLDQAVVRGKDGHDQALVPL
jgi:hypothetical protein